MELNLQPWQLYLVILAGWINRQQQEVIEYLLTENRVLKEKLGKKRILPNDDQRRRPAVKGNILGRKQLEEFGTLFTPDLTLQFARKNPRRGCDRIQGGLANVGYRISVTGRVLSARALQFSVMLRYNQI